MSEHVAKPAKRRWFAPALLTAGVAGTVLLSLSMTGTMSAFTAAITNTTNTAASGSIILQETSGANTCASSDTTTSNVATNSASCSTINKYGGQTGMVPGSSATTVLTFKNLGSAPAGSFSVKFSACTQTAVGTYQGGATDFCSKLNISLYTGGTVTAGNLIATKTATDWATATASTPQTLTSLPVAAGVSYTVVAALDASAGNSYQGYQASQPIIWTLSS